MSRPELEPPPPDGAAAGADPAPGMPRSDRVGRRRADRRCRVRLLRLQPGLERLLGHDMDGGAHQRVPAAAQLGALGGVVAGPRRGGPHGRRDARYGVELHRELGDEEAVDDVKRMELEHDRLVLGEVQVGGDDVLAARVVGELERELPLGDVDRDRARLVLLVVAEHDVGVADEADDQHRRQGRPDDLEPRVAVDRRAVLLLLARLHPELPDREQDDGHDERSDRYRRDQQHVVERVDVVRLVGTRRREPRNREHDRDTDHGQNHDHYDHLKDGVFTHRPAQIAASEPPRS